MSEHTEINMQGGPQRSSRHELNDLAQMCDCGVELVLAYVRRRAEAQHVTT